MSNWNKIFNSFLSIITIIVAFYLLYQGEYNEMVIAIIYLLILWLPSLISNITSIHFPNILITLYSSYTFLTVLLGGALRFLRTVYQFDTFTHFLFGFIIGFFIIYIFIKWKQYQPQQRWFMAFIILAISLACGNLWEIIEFICDQLIGSNMQHVETGVTDTMKDMMVHGMGTILFLGWYIIDYYWNANNIFKRYEEGVKKQ